MAHSISLLDALPQEILLIIAEFSDRVPEQLHHSTLEPLFTYTGNDSIQPRVNWEPILLRARLATYPSDPWYSLVTFYRYYCTEIMSLRDEGILSKLGAPKNTGNEYISLKVSAKNRRRNASLSPPPGIKIIKKTKKWIVLECNHGMDTVLRSKISCNVPFISAGSSHNTRPLRNNLSLQSFLNIARSENLSIEIYPIYREFRRRCRIVSEIPRRSLPRLIYEFLDVQRFINNASIGSAEYPVILYDVPERIEWLGINWKTRMSRDGIMTVTPEERTAGDEDSILRRRVASLMQIHRNIY